MRSTASTSNRFLRFLVAALVMGVVATAANGQQASFSGTVFIDGTPKPLADAEVTVTDLKLSTRSDKAGNFLLNGLPAGTHSIVVRVVGYEPFTADITFGATQKVEADVMMTVNSTKLAKVDVKADASAPYKIKLAEFEERRKMGVGKFMTADIFEKADGRPPSSVLLEHIAGLRVMQVNGQRLLANARGETLGSNKPRDTNGNPCTPGSCFDSPPRGCYLQIILNGVTYYNGAPGQKVPDFDSYNTKDIIGLEYYTVATTPLKYKGTSPAAPCGTVVIWTKG